MKECKMMGDVGFAVLEQESGVARAPPILL